MRKPHKVLFNQPYELDLMRGVWVGRRNQQIEVTHLFFADDTLIFCQLDERVILGLSCILMCFQAFSVLDINLNKSDMVGLGSRENVDFLADLLGCKMTKLPIKYLDLPLGSKYKT